MYAATNGYLDAVPVEKLREYEEQMYKFFEQKHPGILSAISQKKILDDEIKKDLNSALTEFGKQFK